MPSRKRDHEEMETSEPPKEMSLLEKLRNMWEFAAIMQFIFLFGRALKIDEDFDIEDFETECLKPGYSEKLEEIGLALLKWISSHRGLNYEIWDEYTRRQYQAKAPTWNPYGEDEEPKRFRNFDIWTKLRVLHQLTLWVFWNPDRIREKMTDHQREVDQLEWRMEELGYDREDRQYYLLDDNRLYRRTEPPLPAPPKPKPKANTLKAQAARRRGNKRRRIVHSETPEVNGTEDENSSPQPHHEDEDDQTNGVTSASSVDVDTFGGYKWECIAITLTQYEDFCDSLNKSRDPNEKELRERLIENVIPIIEAAEEKQRRKMERRERELLALEKMATAKRSSRIAGKLDRERHEKEAAEAERKRAHDLAEAHRQQELQEKMERDRQSRMMTREQRIKDREFKRLLKEEELAKAEEEAKKVEAGEARLSERHLKDKLERAKKDLEELDAEDEWTFDCSGCGMHGKNLDDGSHSVACETCNVWQHSKCLGISKAAAEDEHFHFVCKDCRKREEEAKRPKITIKVRNPNSLSPEQAKSDKPAAPPHKFVGIDLPKKRPVGRPRKDANTPNGTQQSAPPAMQSSQNAPLQGYQYYTSRPTPAVPFGQQYPQYANGYAQPFNNTTSTPTAQSPIQLANGYQARPGSSGQPLPGSLYHQQAATMVYPGQQAAFQGRFPPYYNGIPHQYQQYPPGVRPPSSHGSRPTSSQGATSESPISQTQHFTSPVVNRPNMSPTQGNYDVGPVAGLQQRSPPLTYQHSAISSSHPRPHHSPNYQGQLNGVGRPPSLGAAARIPSATQLSGLSPTKHSPIPQPSIPQKVSMSPPPAHLQEQYRVQQQQNQFQPTASSPPMRSVSNTAIFPPTRNLVPSPDQLSKSPVPTPSKQPISSENKFHGPTMPTMDGAAEQQMGRDELKRVTDEAKENVRMPADIPRTLAGEGANGANE